MDGIFVGTSAVYSRETRIEAELNRSTIHSFLEVWLQTKIQKKNKGNVIKNVEKVVCVTGFVSNDEAKKFDFGPMVCNIIVPDTRFDELFTRRGHVVLLVVVTLLA